MRGCPGRGVRILLVDRLVMVGDDADVLCEVGDCEAVGAVAVFMELDASHDSWNEVIDIGCSFILESQQIVTMVVLNLHESAHLVLADPVGVGLSVHS